MKAAEFQICTHISEICSEDSDITFEEFKKLFCEHENVKHFLSQFSFTFKNTQNLILSFCHPSFSNEHFNRTFGHYERSEFLGDSLLGCIVAEDLWTLFPDFQEGRLSKLKGATVNQAALYELGNALGIHHCVLVGKGEFRTKVHLCSSVVSDVVEAFLAAVYIEGGFEILRNVFREMIELYKVVTKKEFYREDRLFDFDPKSKLQEECLRLYKKTPVYKSQQLENGQFEVSLYVCEKEVAKNCNASKKKAEKDLAREVLALKKYMINGEDLC